MNTPLLLNAEQIRQYEDLSANIKQQRLSNFIKKAQELDLKPFLGHAFYYQLLSFFTAENNLSESTPQCYQDLYNGCSYTDQAGHTLSFDGLIPALSYFTLARLTESDTIHFTASGPVVKQQENTNCLKPAEITKLVQHQRSIANAYLRDVEKYLQANKAQFPLWHYNEKNASARQPGPRIRGIDKTEFNYPNGNVAASILYMPDQLL